MRLLNRMMHEGTITIDKKLTSFGDLPLLKDAMFISLEDINRELLGFLPKGYTYTQILSGENKLMLPPFNLTYWEMGESCSKMIINNALCGMVTFNLSRDNNLKVLILIVVGLEKPTIFPSTYTIQENDESGEIEVIAKGNYSDNHSEKDGTVYLGCDVGKAYLKIMRFLSCRNIVLAENKFKERVAKKLKKQKASIVYRTVKFNPDLRTKPSRLIGFDEIQKLSKRFGVVRGHIKRYVNNPHVSGKYGNIYCPPHFRGDPSSGFVFKDYKA